MWPMEAGRLFYHMKIPIRLVHCPLNLSFQMGLNRLNFIFSMQVVQCRVRPY